MAVATDREYGLFINGAFAGINNTADHGTEQLDRRLDGIRECMNSCVQHSQGTLDHELNGAQEHRPIDTARDLNKDTDHGNSKPGELCEPLGVSYAHCKHQLGCSVHGRFCRTGHMHPCVRRQSLR